jgi:hypothetical protein
MSVSVETVVVKVEGTDSVLEVVVVTEVVVKVVSDVVSVFVFVVV